MTQLTDMFSNVIIERTLKGARKAARKDVVLMERIDKVRLWHINIKDYHNEQPANRPRAYIPKLALIQKINSITTFTQKQCTIFIFKLWCMLLN